MTTVSSPGVSISDIPYRMNFDLQGIGLLFRSNKDPSMTSLISQPSWLDAALEFCIAKTRNNLATLESFPERTEGGHWVHDWRVGIGLDCSG